MADHTGELASLIGSRICHDLISPIGAINNGLELLDLTGASSGPEMDLISESVDNAGARIRFFRIAYGAAGNQDLGANEVRAVLEAMSKGGRLALQWSLQQDLPRSVVRLAFLAIQCCETSMPYGGTVTITNDGDTCSVTGTGSKISVDEPLWAVLSNPGAGLTPVTPASVQFALLPIYAYELERRVRVHSTPDAVTIKF